MTIGLGYAGDAKSYLPLQPISYYAKGEKIKEGVWTKVILPLNEFIEPPYLYNRIRVFSATQVHITFLCLGMEKVQVSINISKNRNSVFASQDTWDG